MPSDMTKPDTDISTKTLSVINPFDLSGVDTIAMVSTPDKSKGFMTLSVFVEMSVSGLVMSLGIWVLGRER